MVAPAREEVALQEFAPAPRSRRLRRLGAVVIAAVGLVLLASALTQPVQSWVGTQLLDQTLADRMAASRDEQADSDRWRPWPWANLAPIAELRFPELGEQRVVVDSASGEALAWGVGHMSETAPLGSPGVSVIAGHRDGAFDFLDQVLEGDSVELTTVDGTTVRYVIEERLVVDSRFAQLPIVHAGPDELILTTCWPIQALISGPERLLLRARPLSSEGPQSGVDA